MVGKFLSDPKRTAIAALAVILAVFVCMVFIVGFGWTSYLNRATLEPTMKPVSFDYCGERLTSLCVVSFGRDVFGDTVINLYVPLRKYPPFYLNIIRKSGESRFECEWDKKVRTKVHCTGEAIGLGEGFEMQLLSIKDDEIIAQGKFVLTAYLVTTQTADGEPTASDTPAPAPTEKASPTPTETPEESSPTPTETPTEEGTETPEVTETATP